MIPGIEIVATIQEEKQSIPFYEIQEQIITEIQSQENQLTAIRSLDAPLIIKWQKFLGIILPIQINVLKNWGLGKDQAALADFNKLFMQEAAHNLSLQEINERKWIFLFEKTFGLKEVRKISLEEARSLVQDICSAMIAEEFLTQVDAVMEKIGREAPVLQKRQELLTVLFPLHMSVMSKHGFTGEEGYIQAQKALMDYYFDAEIMENVNLAQETVFKRCHLI